MMTIIMTMKEHRGHPQRRRPRLHDLKEVPVLALDNESLVCPGPKIGIEKLPPTIGCCGTRMMIVTTITKMLAETVVRVVVLLLVEVPIQK
jgi:hypothetical protein